jgi:hypothetical protein
MPPRIAAGGGPSAPVSDDQITRTDITPEDIRKMSSEEIIALLEKIRSSRQTAPPARAPRQAKVKATDGDNVDDLE